MNIDANIDIPTVKALKAFVTFPMSRALNKLNAQTSHFLKQHSDLSLVEWRVLRLLAAMGETTMTHLAHQVQMDKGQLSRKIKSMTAKSLVSAELDDVDHRQQNLNITDKGQSVVEDLMPLITRRQKFILQDVSDAELEVFYQVLNKLDKAAEARDIP